MPRNGSNVYSLPAGTYGVPGEVIESAPYNAFLDDLVTDLNTARAISVGGTGATTAGNALINLRGLAIYPSRANFEGGSPPLALAQWCVLHDDTILHYVADAAGTAITSANGLKGSPAGVATFGHWGCVGDGVTDNAADMLAACTSGVSILAGAPGKTYYFNSEVTVSSVSNLLIDLTGCEILQGPDANPGWQFVDCTDVYMIGGKSGQWTGNYDTAGPWKSHATTGGITDGDGTGSSAATYTGVNTITVNLLGTGYVKKGSRLSYIVSNVTYSYIVQADVAIVAGVATNIVLDRVLDVSLTSGRTVYISWYSRRMVLAAAATAGATSITLECGNVTSADGAPMMLAGDQFFLHTDHNNIDSIDTGSVFEVAADATFSGSYPAKTATITLTAPIPADIPLGTMITSIMDHRNNRFVPVLFWDCARCGVIGMKLDGARLHGFTANAVINAPWRGLNPEDYPNTGMVFADNYDNSSDGAGGAIVGVWNARTTVKNNNLFYAAGSVRKGLNFERSSQTEISENIITRGKDGIKINGECTDIIIRDNRLTNVQSAISQLNSCQRVTIESNHIICDPATTLVAIRVVAGLEGEEEAGTASTLRTNFTKIIDNTIEGGTNTTNPNYGDHIIVSPIGFNTATREEDYPRHVEVRGNISIGAGRNGIRAMMIDKCAIEENVIYQSGAEGIYAEATGGADNRINGNSITDAGEVTSAYAVRVVGGTDWEIADNLALVDTGTGQLGDLLVEGGATITKMRPSGPETAITPAHGGAAENGVADDLAAYNAAFAAAPTNFTFQMAKPSVLSGAITQGGKEPLFEQLNPIAWPTSTDASRAFPGIPDATLPAKYAKVLHKRTNRTDGGGSLFVSTRALATASVGDYEKDGILSIAISSDPSAGTANGGTGANINRDAVGIGARGYIQIGNTAGRVWGLNAYVYVPSGAEGIAQAIEVNVDHAASVVTDFSLPFQKNGINITTKGLAGTFGAVVNKGTGDGWTYGFAVDSNALDATVGKSAFEYRTFWRVSKAGDMFVGKATGADTETGIALMQANGVAQFARNGNTGTTQFLRGDTLVSAANLWNLDVLGYNASGTQKTFAEIQTSATTVTAGVEASEFRFKTMQAGTLTEGLRVNGSGAVLALSLGGLGYGTGAGGAVTQTTSRTTGVTIDTPCGQITLVSAAGSATPQTFTVTNSKVAAGDAVVVSQRSGTDKYIVSVTAVAAGSFAVTFYTTGGTTTEQPIFTFAVIKAVAA